jgi:hypothetical protein
MNALPVAICEDDEEIKMLLVKHGKQTHLVPRIEVTGPFRTHVTFTADDFVYTVTQYHGYLLPDDNGYCAMRIPLSAGTTKEISQVIRAFIESGQDESGPYYAMECDDCAEAN